MAVRGHTGVRLGDPTDEDAATIRRLAEIEARLPGTSQPMSVGVRRQPRARAPVPDGGFGAEVEAQYMFFRVMAGVLHAGPHSLFIDAPGSARTGGVSSVDAVLAAAGVDARAARMVEAATQGADESLDALTEAELKAGLHNHTILVKDGARAALLAALRNIALVVRDTIGSEPTRAADRWLAYCNNPEHEADRAALAEVAAGHYYSTQAAANIFVATAVTVGAAAAQADIALDYFHDHDTAKRLITDLPSPAAAARAAGPVSVRRPVGR